MLYQQGDVLMREVDSIPEGLEVKEDGILAEGEATGHAHRILGEGAKPFESPLGEVLWMCPNALRWCTKSTKRSV